jgi:hypothetical protein
LWKIFQSLHKRSSRQIPSRITRDSRRPNGDSTTYLYFPLGAIFQLASCVSRCSHIQPLLLNALGLLKPWALIVFFFRSWRRRHAYLGNLLDFHLLSHQIFAYLSRGDPRMCCLPFGCLRGQKFGENVRHSMHKIKCRGSTKIVNTFVY